MAPTLPLIPAKRYFAIGEVSELCGVKPHVLRYWEQEFTQLRPMKRRGNRRYYQHHEVLMIRRIRDLLYEQGFTISGARNKLQEFSSSAQDKGHAGDIFEGMSALHNGNDVLLDAHDGAFSTLDGHALVEVSDPARATPEPWPLRQLLGELREIRDLLTPPF